MGSISAKFTLNLPQHLGYLCAKGSPQTVINLCTDIEDFKVSVQLHSDKSVGLRKADKDEDRFVFNKAEILLTRENEVVDDDVMLTGRLRYLLMEYQPVVIEALNRIYRFFKFQLRNPLIKEINTLSFLENEKQFYNPQWINSEGTLIENSDNEVDSGIVLIKGVGFLNDDFLGIQLYEHSSKTALEANFNNPINVPLYEELLSDAQTAAIQGNTRRAVLELAIATEVYVKNSFFGRDSVSCATFEYMEDRGRATVRALELIDSGAKYALNCSFKEDMPKDFKNIDFIFRCRNKIAHRGDPTYRDDNGDLHKCASEKIQKWWASVITLINWLNSKLSEKDKTQ